MPLSENKKGQTPLDPNFRKDLIPNYIQTQGELDEYEQSNMSKAIQKYLLKTRNDWDLSAIEMLKQIHKDMFGQTWKWAGIFRTTDTQIGSPWFEISNQMKNACDDFRYWIQHKIYEPIEIAVRYHHRLVWIHPFPNGNGRFARLVADIFIRQQDLPKLTWGNASLKEGKKRQTYLHALKKADEKNFYDLIEFAKRK